VRDLLGDIRHAIRVLSGAPVAASLAVLSLALAVAGAASIFIVIDAFVFRTLPVHRPDRLVSIWLAGKDGSATDVSVPMFRALAARQTVFTHTAGWSGDLVLNIEAGGQTGLANVWAVTDDFFGTLGEKAARGRLLDSGHRSQGPPLSDDAVVIGDRLWHERFGRDPAVIGRTIRIEGHAFTIVGVTQPRFTGPSLGVGIDAAVRLAALPRLREAVGVHANVLHDPAFMGLAVAGRLIDDVTLPAACAQLASHWQAMLDDVMPPAAGAPAREAVRASRLRCTAMAYGTNADARAAVVRPYYIVLGLGVVVAIVGSLHVALLLQQLVVRRSHDLAVRLALGASRGRLMRHVLMLGALIALAGVAMGVWLAQWGSRQILAMIADRGFLPLIVDLRLTGPVLAASAAMALLLTLLSSVASCGFVLRQAPGWLVATARSGSSVGIGSVSKVLLVAKISAALALVIGAATLHRTVDTWTAGTGGPQTDGLLMSRLLAHPVASPKQHDASYYRVLVEQVAGLPGVSAAGLSMYEAGAAWQYETRVTSPQPGANARRAVLAWISPGFLEALEVPMQRGRDVAWSDTHGAQPVAIISDGLARLLFPHDDAIGREIRLEDPAAPSPVRIVGVVPDARVFDLRQPAQPAVYLPWLQAPGSYVRNASHLVVRHAGDGPTVTAALRETAASLGQEYVVWTRSAEDVAARAMSTERLASGLAAFYAAVTMLLTFIGVLGAMSLMTERRTREIGIRLALGAQRAQVLRLVLSQALRLLLLGLALSLPLALAVHRSLASQIVGLGTSDAWDGVAAVLAVSAACASASCLPAFRAIRTAPAAAMRRTN